MLKSCALRKLVKWNGTGDKTRFCACHHVAPARPSPTEDNGTWTAYNCECMAVMFPTWPREMAQTCAFLRPAEWRGPAEFLGVWIKVATGVVLQKANLELFFLGESTKQFLVGRLVSKHIGHLSMRARHIFLQIIFLRIIEKIHVIVFLSFFFFFVLK